MTIGLFFGDKVKSTILSVLFGSAIYFGLMKIIEWAGTDFYWYVVGFFVAFMLLAVNIVPNFIMPLFNKYEPLP
jgi:STE24 endopeptidase